MSTRRHRWLVPSLWLLSVVVAVAVGWLAAAQAVTPERIELPESAAVTVEVSDQTLRLEQTYVVHAGWLGTPTGINGYDGILTGIDVTGALVEPGDTLFSVDLRSTIAAEGSVPAFRDLAVGARGADVEQLQRFLGQLQHYSGEPNGVFDQSTAAAVLSWSRATGFGDDRTVPLGRILFLPTLPAHIGPAEGVEIGDIVTAGQQLISVVPPTPQFSLPVLEDAAARIQPGMTVEIPVDDDIWHAEVAELISAENGMIEARLAPADGADSICGNDCAVLVNPGDTAQLQGLLILVPETSGPALPTAAIRADASGQTTVLLEDGTSVPVTVLASANGLSIVDGVETGQRVLVRGDAGVDDAD